MGEERNGDAALTRAMRRRALAIGGQRQAMKWDLSTHLRVNSRA
jgi:hypothetical protein